jgi:hypothetical protein
MACRAILDIALREFRMQATTTSHTKRDEPCLLMRLRQELRLIDVAAGVVTRRAKGLLIVTRLTLCSFFRGRNSMRKLEVQIVDFGQFHSLAAIDRGDPRRHRRGQVFSGQIDSDEIGAIVAVGARFLRVARCAGRRRRSGDDLVFVYKICPIVFPRPKRS